MVKIIEVNGVLFAVRFSYPKGRKNSKHPCRALITPLDENMRMITKRELFGKTSSEPVNRTAYGKNPKEMERVTIPAIANSLIALMEQRGMCPVSTSGPLPSVTDLADIATSVKDAFFSKYKIKYHWALSTQHAYLGQYDAMVKALRGVDYRTLTPDIESTLQETICRTALQTSQKGDEWITGQEPLASAKKRLRLFYLLLEFLRSDTEYDVPIAPAHYQGKRSHKKLLLQRTDHARSLPEDLLRKMCDSSVLEGQVGILADSGLRISEYGGLLFCSVGFIDGSQGRMYFIRVSGQLGPKNIRTEYTKTDPSYRAIPLSQELGRQLLEEQRDRERQYGDVSLLLRLGQPAEDGYRTDPATIAANMRKLTEQIPELLRRPEFLEAIRKNRACTFDEVLQDKHLSTMLTCHALRRNFCTWLYGVSGIETNSLYRIMGHENKNGPHRSGACGATLEELYRLCLQKHVSDTLYHAAHPLRYTLGSKYREAEVPACALVLTLPPHTAWEIVVADSEPFNEVHLRGDRISQTLEYQDEFSPNPARYALLASKEAYAIQGKRKMLDGFLEEDKSD